MTDIPTHNGSEAMAYQLVGYITDDKAIHAYLKSHYDYPVTLSNIRRIRERRRSQEARNYLGGVCGVPKDEPANPTPTNDYGVAKGSRDLLNAIAREHPERLRL